MLHLFTKSGIRSGKHCKMLTEPAEKSLVDNPFAQSQRLYQPLIIMVAVLALIAISILGVYINRASDPYIQEVLSLPGDIDRGQAIFQINCAGCHGFQGDGNVGPSLHGVPRRKSRVRLIHQVVSGTTPPMPKFQPFLKTWQIY